MGVDTYIQQTKSVYGQCMAVWLQAKSTSTGVRLQLKLLTSSGCDAQRCCSCSMWHNISAMPLHFYVGYVVLLVVNSKD